MEFIPTKLGVALIEGFDRMNFETSLGKPFLRKEMELKMKAICDGRTTKQVVLNESIQQYRQVFMQSKQKLGVLKSVRFLSFLFSYLFSDASLCCRSIMFPSPHVTRLRRLARTRLLPRPSLSPCTPVQGVARFSPLVILPGPRLGS